jgi:hypothetical protein
MGRRRTLSFHGVNKHPLISHLKVSVTPEGVVIMSISPMKKLKLRAVK